MDETFSFRYRRIGGLAFGVVDARLAAVGLIPARERPRASLSSLRDQLPASAHCTGCPLPMDVNAFAPPASPPSPGDYTSCAP